MLYVVPVVKRLGRNGASIGDSVPRISAATRSASSGASVMPLWVATNVVPVVGEAGDGAAVGGDGSLTDQYLVDRDTVGVLEHVPEPLQDRPHQVAVRRDRCRRVDRAVEVERVQHEPSAAVRADVQPGRGEHAGQPHGQRCGGGDEPDGRRAGQVRVEHGHVRAGERGDLGGPPTGAAHHDVGVVPLPSSVRTVPPSTSVTLALVCTTAPRPRASPSRRASSMAGMTCASSGKST